MNPTSFQTKSLLSHPQGAAITRVLAAAIQAVDPYSAVLNHFHLEDELLQVGEQTYDLAEVRRIVVVGAGKAGTPMARAVLEMLGNRINAGLVIVKDGHAPSEPFPRIEICQAAHPLPDQRGVAATRRIMHLLQGLGPQDLVVCLISGGGSALLSAPAQDISLTDLQALTGNLLACGASINEINSLRKHLDLVKGGGLARWAYPARIVSLILSDVMGDPLDVIASGPCVPDPSTYQEALAVLDKYGLLEQTPAAIRERLLAGLRGDIPETPGPDNRIFAAVQNLVVASNAHAARAALEQVRAEGWNGLRLADPMLGEASLAGASLAVLARRVAERGEPLARPACLVAGGETTVTLHGQGLGGRNQEIALAAVPGLAGLSNACLVTLATDGGDGPTDAAGAVVTGETLARAEAAGLSAAQFLSRNDSYHFFQPLGDLLLPGPTLTNVNDLAFLFLL